MQSIDDATQQPPAWEASKENVLPIKRGRSAKGLSETLVRPLSEDSHLEAQEQAFETQLKDTAYAEPLERLELYCKYWKWVRDSFPKGNTKGMELLEVYV